MGISFNKRSPKKTEAPWLKDWTSKLNNPEVDKNIPVNNAFAFPPIFRAIFVLKTQEPIHRKK